MSSTATKLLHVIGEIFDKVYNLGGITTRPLEHLQWRAMPAMGH